MNSDRHVSTLRRAALAAGALGAAGALAVSGALGSGVAMTEAAWTVDANVKAEIDARWMEGFTRVTDPGWRMSNNRSSALPSSVGLRGPSETKRNFTLQYPHAPAPQSGEALADGNDDSRSNPSQTEIVPRRPSTLAELNLHTPETDLWMGRYSDVIFDESAAEASHCMSYPSPTDFTATTSTCGATTNTRLVAQQQTTGFTFQIRASDIGSKATRINVSGFSSKAACKVDGNSNASISDGTVLEVARDSGNYNRNFENNRDIKTYIPAAANDNPDIANDGTTNQWVRYNAEGTDPNPNASNVLLINIRKNTYTKPFYALAEMDMVIQVYSAGDASSKNGTFIDQINLPITRSECGFNTGSTEGAQLETMRGTFRGDPNQLGWSAPVWPTGTITNATTRIETVTYPPTESAPAGRMMLRDSSPEAADSTSATSAPPTTTSTSPLENAAGDITTTSAPPTPGASTTTSARPNPSGEDESPSAGTSIAATTSTTRRTTTVASPGPTVTATPTSSTSPPATQVPTSTSAAPGVVIPDEPGPLSPSARLEDVGTVTESGEDFVVVTPGTTVPTDAQQGVATLEVWLSGGDPGDTWATFTSDDPAADGWRWAAINQETGTVVYIR